MSDYARAFGIKILFDELRIRVDSLSGATGKEDEKSRATEKNLTSHFNIRMCARIFVKAMKEIKKP